MVKFFKFSHVVASSMSTKLVPLLNKAYGPLLGMPAVTCDVTWYCENGMRLIKPVTFGEGRRDLECNIGGYSHFDFRTPPIWSDRVGWQFMPTIESWLKAHDAIANYGTPKTIGERRVCQEAIDTLVKLLGQKMGPEMGIWAEWKCPTKFVRYVCVEAHKRSEHKINRIFFQHNGVSGFRVMLMSDTGYCWNLYETSYDNYVTLDFDLNDGFHTDGVPRDCVEQFEEWRKGDCRGDIFKL